MFKRAANDDSLVLNFLLRVLQRWAESNFGHRSASDAHIKFHRRGRIVNVVLAS